MDANSLTLIQTVAIFAALFGFWWKLDGKVEKVREASETAHKDIREDLGSIKIEQGKHSERFNTLEARIDCIDDKFDEMNRRLDKTS